MNRLPPGSGNALVTTLKHLRDPYGLLLETARRYGDPYSWPGFLGQMVVTGAPEGSRTLFSADPDTYSALGAELLGPILGESNLILLSGKRHQGIWKLRMPPFHGALPQAGAEERSETRPQVGAEEASVEPEAGARQERRKERRPPVDFRGAAAQDIRGGRVDLHQVRRQAAGAGVR